MNRKIKIANNTNLFTMTKSLLHVCFILFYSYATGQDYFERVYEEIHTTTGRSIRQTNDGGFITCGATRDSLGSGGTDFLFKKFDAAGNETWTQFYGGFSDDKAYNIRQTPDGGFVFCGELIFAESYKDLFIGKLDSLGNLEWDNSTGGLGREYGLNIVVLDDAYVVIGVTETFGAGGSNIFLVKFDLFGNKLWEKTFGGTLNENGRGIAKTPDGNIILAGNSELVDDEGDGNKQLYMIKIDLDGNVIWERYFGANGTDKAYSVTIGSDGNYVASGYSLKNGSKQGYIVKVDKDGNLLWQNNFPEVGYLNNFRSIDHLDDGSYIVVGNSQNAATGIYDVIVLHCDSEGKELWRKKYGGASEERGYNITVCDDNNFIFVGVSGSSSTDDLGDFWVVKTLNCDNFEMADLNIITNSGTLSCDSLLLEATPGFANYLWSNGSQTQQIYAKKSGWYRVSSQIDQCKSSSDSVYISIINPTDSLISSRLLASCEGNYYELALNRNILDFDSIRWSNGKQGPVINVSESGTYSLTVTNNVCGSFTENINVFINNSRPLNFSYQIGKPYEILLNWDSVVGAENYQILYGLDGDSSIKSNTGDISKRIFDLRCCANYSFYVKSFCENSPSKKIGPLLYSTPKCAGVDCNSDNNLIFEFYTDYENQIANIIFVYPGLSIVSINITDLQGRIVEQYEAKSYQKISFDMSRYSPGMYVLVAEIDEHKQSEKLLIR